MKALPLSALLLVCFVCACAPSTSTNGSPSSNSNKNEESPDGAQSGTDPTPTKDSGDGTDSTDDATTDESTAEEPISYPHSMTFTCNSSANANCDIGQNGLASGASAFYLKPSQCSEGMSAADPDASVPMTFDCTNGSCTQTILSTDWISSDDLDQTAAHYMVFFYYDFDGSNTSSTGDMGCCYDIDDPRDATTDLTIDITSSTNVMNGTPLATDACQTIL